jgi:hypothetical protein
MHASIRQMATPISIANIARIAAGLISMLWAIIAIGDAFAALTARGGDATLVLEIVAGFALFVAAAMALGRRGKWRAWIVVAAAALTLVRLMSVLGAGDALLVTTSIAMFAAIAGTVAAAMLHDEESGRTAGRPNPRHTGVPPDRPHHS